MCVVCVLGLILPLTATHQQLPRIAEVEAAVRPAGALHFNNRNTRPGADVSFALYHTGWWELETVSKHPGGGASAAGVRPGSSSAATNGRSPSAGERCDADAECAKENGEGGEATSKPPQVLIIKRPYKLRASMGDTKGVVTDKLLKGCAEQCSSTLGEQIWSSLSISLQPPAGRNVGALMRAYYVDALDLQHWVALRVRAALTGCAFHRAPDAAKIICADN